MVGKLQTNKVKFALKLFDFIHSLDSEKLAKKISDEQKKQDLKPKIFIQINIGNEKQKSGINKDRIQAVGHGDSSPVVKNYNPSNRAKNSRVEIRIEMTDKL